MALDATKQSEDVGGNENGDITPYLPMIVRVFGDGAPTDVPVTPETTCSDVIECCRDPGDESCNLVAVCPQHGECPLQETDHPLEILQRWGSGRLVLRYTVLSADETLRKYPSVPFLFRECTQDYLIPDSDVVIEKGTLLFIPIFGVQNDPEYYPNPDKFDPERFSPENKAKRHHFAWLPFGEGPRNCIGLRFGVMQTKVALAVLIKNYKFSLNYKTKLPLTFDPKAFFLSVEGGIWLNVEAA